MSEKVAILALCFSYGADRSLRLPAVPKDLKKVLGYAAWLNAKVYLVTDFPCEGEGAKIAGRLGIAAPAQTNLAPQPRSRPLTRGDTESADSKKIEIFADQVARPYVIVYYSGHATDKSIVLPDGSRLGVAALHQRLAQAHPRGICWILDACELSGRSLRLPFVCLNGRSVMVLPHGVHVVPTVALSSTFCPSSKPRRPRLSPARREFPRTPNSRRPDPPRSPSVGEEEEEEDAGAATETEWTSRAESSSFAVGEDGSLFTSALVPLLMNPQPTEWCQLLGSLSQCCGYRGDEPMCLKLNAFVSDAGLTYVPHWMRRESCERRGEFWVFRR